MNYEQYPLENGDLLLPLTTEYKPQAIFMQADERIYLDISIHSGMYSTTILIFPTGEPFGQVNFRFFPRYSGIEIYKWGESINRVHIVNLTVDTYSIGTCKTTLATVRPTETIILERNILNTIRQFNKQITLI